MIRINKWSDVRMVHEFFKTNGRFYYVSCRVFMCEKSNTNEYCRVLEKKHFNLFVKHKFGVSTYSLKYFIMRKKSNV